MLSGAQFLMLCMFNKIVKSNCHALSLMIILEFLDTTNTSWILDKMTFTFKLNLNLVSFELDQRRIY